MTNRSGAVLVLGITLGAFSIAFAQIRPKEAAKAMLSALDYAEIEQLYSHYAFAFDTATEDGEAVARLFTPDGSFRFPLGDPAGRSRCRPECRGHDALVALTRGAGNKGPLTLAHITTNIAIDPAPEGAHGRAYLLMPATGATAPALTIVGLYEDVIVKAADGWRFKVRSFTQLPSFHP